MNEETYPFITRKLQQSIENGSTPGVALLIDKNGELLYRYAVGYAQQYPEHKDLHERTIFDIASLTKVVATTTALMLLLQENKIGLDDPVDKYLPEFPHQQTSLHHLLTHSAGLPNWWPLYEDVQEAAAQRGTDFVGSPEAKQCVLEKLCQIKPLSIPGKHYVYSDLGFILLGFLIEKISGKTLDRYCEEMIFTPLGMSNTFFRKHGDPLPEGEYVATERCEWRHRILCGEVHDENAYAMGGVAGHAGLFSTLDDIRLLMSALRQCYEGDETFLSPTIVRDFSRCQSLPKTSSRALGWDTPSEKDSTGGELLSKTSIGHTGFTGTSIWLDLERKLLILLFSNRVHPSRNNQKFLKMRPKIHDTVVITMDKLDAGC